MEKRNLFTSFIDIDSFYIDAHPEVSVLHSSHFQVIIIFIQGSSGATSHGLTNLKNSKFSPLFTASSQRARN